MSILKAAHAVLNAAVDIQLPRAAQHSDADSVRSQDKVERKTLLREQFQALSGLRRFQAELQATKADIEGNPDRRPFEELYGTLRMIEAQIERDQRAGEVMLNHAVLIAVGKESSLCVDLPPAKPSAR